MHQEYFEEVAEFTKEDFEKLTEGMSDEQREFISTEGLSFGAQVNMNRAQRRALTRYISHQKALSRRHKRAKLARSAAKLEKKMRAQHE